MLISLKKLKTIFIILFCSGLALFLLVAKNIDLTIPVKNGSCDVYEALFSQVIEQSPKYPYFLNSNTLTPNRLSSTDENRAPTMFGKETGQYETLENDPLGENYQRAIIDEKFFDTTPFFTQILNENIRSIKKCNFNKTSNIKFYDGKLNFLTARENLMNFSDEIRPTIVSFSNVGFSKNDEHALVYIQYYCGGLCGWGGYVLFERHENKWLEFGTRTIWVS